MSDNRHLSGNFAPVERELTAANLPVTGQIPRELCGRLLRIGPNPVAPDPATYHWFLGNGMLHGLRLRDGRAEWYRNRYVRDDAVVQALGSAPTPRPAGREAGGVANSNVIAHAGRLWAIVEAGGLPMELDDGLESVRYSDFDGTLSDGFTAHPKRDPDTGELHGAVYSFLWRHIRYTVVGTDGRVVKTVDVPTPGSPMVHDCAITRNWFVLLDLPVVFEPPAEGERVALPYRWRPDYGARVGLLPRDGAAEDAVWCEVAPCYVFHPLNAYEDSDGRVVLDVVRHPEMFASDTRGRNERAPTLWRWLVDPKGGPVKEQQLHDVGQEFPRHDERLVGKPHRYGYTTEIGAGLQLGRLIKHDLRNGAVEFHDEGRHRHFLEPVFVPRSDGADEDDGWILAYVYDAERDGSDVAILHAQDLGGGPVATIHLPQRVPFGFHGNWVPDTD
jgi:carotenoid cleavage dioxygenase-like enzyme